MIVTVFDMSSGSIKGCYMVSETVDADAMTDEGMAWIEGESDRRLHYVLDGEIIDRPVPDMWPGGAAPYTLAMDADEHVTATNEGGEVVETSDSADPVTLTEPGIYAVKRRKPFPYREVTAEVEVTNA